ncbi:unnamed protein product, partial [Ectocarpus sp. 12 AP-2014]
RDVLYWGIAGAIPQARGSLDGRTRAALERRPRTARSPGALPLERRGVGSRHKISRAGGASARALRPDSSAGRV